MTSISHNGLPNYVREQLIQAEKTYVARVYDALIAIHWQLERVFTEAEALDALKPLGIGRRALREALASHAFKHLEQTRPTAGRPAKLYQARDIGDLAAQFYIIPDVFPSQAHIHPAMETDRLQRDDMAHGAYKRALHREMIRRRKGKRTTRQWLAARLNVCARTLRRWEKRLRIAVEKQLEYHVFTGSMIADLPTDLPNRRPIWLEALGRRWRATQHTAEFLLNQTIDVTIVQQHANKYHLTA